MHLPIIAGKFTTKMHIILVTVHTVDIIYHHSGMSWRFFGLNKDSSIQEDINFPQKYF